MDLELTDEQTWLAESVETLLQREWPAAERAADVAPEDQARLWRALVDFGALAVDREDGLGAVELCLVARATGAQLAPVPLSDSAAVRFALEPHHGELLADLGDDRLAVALLEPGRGWFSSRRADRGRPRRPDRPQGRRRARGRGSTGSSSWPVLDGAPGLVLVPADADGIDVRAAAVARRDVAAVHRHAERGRRRRGSRRRRRARGAGPAAASRRSPACSRPRSPSARPNGCSTTLADTRPNGASSGAPSARTRRCATSSPTCTSAPRRAGRPCCTPPPRSTTRSRTPSRPRRSPRPTWPAPRARSRTARCRCSAGSRSPRSTRRTGTCAASSSASSSTATHATTSARSGGRSPRGRPRLPRPPASAATFAPVS